MSGTHKPLQQRKRGYVSRSNNYSVSEVKSDIQSQTYKVGATYHQTDHLFIMWVYQFGKIEFVLWSSML